MRYKGKWSILICPLVPGGSCFLSDSLTQFERIPRPAAQATVQRCAACESSHGQGLQYRTEAAKANILFSWSTVEIPTQSRNHLQSKKKKNQVNAFCCGCCKSFQIGLVWNTEKLNPSQGQKKQFNLNNSINRLVMCLPAGRMRLWVFKW